MIIIRVGSESWQTPAKMVLHFFAGTCLLFSASGSDFVLIPLAVLLVILLTAVIILLCRFFVWEQRSQKKKKYRKVSHGFPKRGGYPKLPSFSKAISTSTQQIATQDQLTPYVDLEKKILKPSSRALLYTDMNGRQYRYETLSANGSDETVRSSNSSVLSESDTGIISDCTYQQPTVSERSFSGSERSYPRLHGITPRHRERFSSVPNLSMEMSKDGLADSSRKEQRKRFRSVEKKRRTSSAISLTSPVGGQIEFGLFYDNENKCLEITISQLLDLTIKAENFLPLLDVYDEHQKTSKVHLVRDADGKIEISDTSNMAFLVYVTLLPNRVFSRHTNVVFGTGNVVFNEKFSIAGYSTEQFQLCQLCFHALCKFGRDGEPIILGEVKVPLKRLQVRQVLPFMANLEPPEEVLEVENYLKPSTELGYLDIHLSYNPLGHKLIVKIVQATGLPKIGMTGHPNVSIKACLFFCNKRICKRSTVIKKRARDPVYSDSFEFDLSKDRLPDCDVLFEVRHHGPMYRTVIGYVTIGTSVGGDGEKHWKALMDFSYHEKRHKIMSHKPIALL